MNGKLLFGIRFVAITSVIWFIFLLKPKNKTQTFIDVRPYHLVLPVGFPDLLIPKDNELTISRVKLGKKLFYDPILSRDSTISCATCHRQSMAFADDVPISPGIAERRGFRNAPSLANVAYLGRLNKDGGVVKLDMQAVVPIEDKDEMDFPLLAAAARLKSHRAYVNLSLKAYGKAPDPFTITRALAAFVRTMISGDSRYDQYHFQQKRNALNASEIRGMNLFFSPTTNCYQCHSGFNFTNNHYENNGLQEEYLVDKGRNRITLLAEDEGKFRVSTLRNVGITAPYMHDGSIATLAEVVEHYNKGGHQHINKNEYIQQLFLNENQRSDLVNFLKSLTDNNFIKKTEFSAPSGLNSILKF